MGQGIDYYNFVIFPDDGGILNSDLPKIKGQGALIIKQLTMLCNLVLLLGSSATGTICKKMTLVEVCSV